MIQGGLPTIFVTDLNKAVAFYTKKLGLKLKFQAGPHWAEVDAGGGLSLGLHPVSKKGPRPKSSRDSILVGFNAVEPIEKVVAKLKKRGVDIDEVRVSPPIKIANFRDLDGNLLYVCEHIG